MSNKPLPPKPGAVKPQTTLEKLAEKLAMDTMLDGQPGDRWTAESWRDMSRTELEAAPYKIWAPGEWEKLSAREKSQASPTLFKKDEDVQSPRQKPNPEYERAKDDFYGKERAPLGETWDSIQEAFAYVGQPKQFVRLSDGELWEVDAFEKQFGYVKRTLRDAEGERLKCPKFTGWIFDQSPGSGLPTYDNFVFMPGMPETYNKKLNQWRASTVEPIEGDTKIWDAHLGYLFANEAARNRVLNWMAWVYQNPARHPNHSILVFGKIQGTGKTILPLTLAKLISALPATPLSQQTLERDHNAWVLRTKLAIVDIRSSNKKLSDLLHDMITGEMTHCDLKCAHDFDIPNVIAYWLETNKPDALAGLDNSDRRHMVETVDGKTPLQPKPQAYYDMLYPAILDDPAALAAIAYALKTRDLKGYSGLHSAPTTEAKREMMTAAADDVEKWMLEHRDEAPYNRTYVTFNELLNDMPDDIQRGPVNGKSARRRIVEVLEAHFNGEKLGKVWINTKIGQPRVWAINKRPGAESVREKFTDAEIANVFLAERWTPTPAELALIRNGLAEARLDFAAD
jgi:hypothetical protein